MLALVLKVVSVCSHAVVPHRPVLPPHLRQAVPHHLPRLGRALRRRGLHRRARLAQPGHPADPQLLLAAQLDGLRHHGPVRPAGGLGRASALPTPMP